MLTQRQAKEQRRALRREIDRDLAQKARAKVKDLRAKVREAYAHKRARVRALAEMCRSERLTLRDRLAATRARVLAELRETARAERAAARAACTLRAGGAVAECGGPIEQAKAELAAERKYQEDLRRIERDNRARKAASPRASTAERRGESDDEVRQTIPRELVGLFERVKRGIKATPRMTRSEAFLKFVEENPHDAFAVIDQKTDQMIRELERQQRDAERDARRTSGVRAARRALKRTYTPAELAEIPF